MYYPESNPTGPKKLPPRSKSSRPFGLSSWVCSEPRVPIYLPKETPRTEGATGVVELWSCSRWISTSSSPKDSATSITGVKGSLSLGSIQKKSKPGIQNQPKWSPPKNCLFTFFGRGKITDNRRCVQNHRQPIPAPALVKQARPLSTLDTASCC